MLLNLFNFIKGSNYMQYNTSKNFNKLTSLVTRVGLSKSTIYKMIKAGNFPPPKQLGMRSVGWLESDIQAWIDSRTSTKVSV